MTRKEVDIHLEQFEMSEMNEHVGMSSLAFKNFKLCQAWGYCSPVVKFIVNNKILKFLKPKWVVALNILIAAFDEGCELNK